jgi:hypothetical protein
MAHMAHELSHTSLRKLGSPVSPVPRVKTGSTSVRTTGRNVISRVLALLGQVSANRRKQTPEEAIVTDMAKQHSTLFIT